MVEAILLIAAAVVGVLLGRWQGRADEREKLEDKAERADETRKEIEDAVNADANLIDRARRSGLVRPE